MEPSHASNSSTFQNMVLADPPCVTGSFFLAKLMAKMARVDVRPWELQVQGQAKSIWADQIPSYRAPYYHTNMYTAIN